jgi:hypothetical protein
MYHTSAHAPDFEAPDQPRLTAEQEKDISAADTALDGLQAILCDLWPHCEAHSGLLGGTECLCSLCRGAEAVQMAVEHLKEVEPELNTSNEKERGQ